MPLDVCQGPTHCLLGVALVIKAGVQAVQKAVSFSLHYPSQTFGYYWTCGEISVFHLFPSKKCGEAQYYLCVP